MTLFDRAKSVGLNHIRDWLPNGKAEGSEWVCLNPTRNDKKLGNFKVNMDSGRWSDFADDAAGNDIISLYAYLNRDNLSGSGYKDEEAGRQTEAAKAILKRHDFTYEEEAPVKKDYWDGFRQITTGTADPLDPMETLRFFEKMWGKFHKYWTFTDKKGRTLFIVARYLKDGKKGDKPQKEDRPFTLWTNGEEIRWRSKNLDSVPLYNRPLFDVAQNLPVLMVEGQKCADASGTVLSDDFVSTTVWRSPDKTDLEPLRGRTVYYWFDPDNAGRKKLAKIKTILADYDVIFKAVHSPTGVKKEYDIADAIEDGWDRQRLIDHITGNEEEEFLDDFEFPFRIIGQTATDIYFFPEETCLVMKFKRSALGKANLMNLMDRGIWGSFYPKDQGGCAWDTASNDLIRRASKTDIFSSEMIRGSGVWMEDGKIIVNTGKNLIIDGKETGLFQKETKFIYEHKKLVPYTINEPLKSESACNLLEVVKHLEFTDKAYSYMLAGWMLLAPFGGALNWRPHAWLSGPQGAGKSHVLERIVYPMVGDFGIRALGTSTTAGLRQGIGNSSICVMMDEAEPDTKKKEELIEDSLSMARLASSGSEKSADILHGTQEGDGHKWIVKSMFLFASIGPGMSHTADKSRVTLLKLKTPRARDRVDRKNKFQQLLHAEKMITPAWVDSFHARTLGIFDQILIAIEIFSEQTADIMGTRREGDQYGSLLAGSYMICHETAPTAAEARSYLEQFSILKGDGGSMKEDEELCLDEILSYKIEVSTIKMSIGAWLRYWFATSSSMMEWGDEFQDIGSIDAGRIKRELEEYGIKPVATKDEYYINIAVGHPEIHKVLRGTPWVKTYPEIIERVSYCRGIGGPSRIGSLNKRFLKFTAENMLLDTIPF